MNLSPDEIGKLLTLYTPGYSCQVERMADDSLTLQFTNIANLETFTIPGFSSAELRSAPLIKRVAKVLFEEMVIASAARSRSLSKRLH